MKLKRNIATVNYFCFMFITKFFIIIWIDAVIFIYLEFIVIWPNSILFSARFPPSYVLLINPSCTINHSLVELIFFIIKKN